MQNTDQHFNRCFFYPQNLPCYSVGVQQNLLQSSEILSKAMIDRPGTILFFKTEQELKHNLSLQFTDFAEKQNF